MKNSNAISNSIVFLTFGISTVCWILLLFNPIDIMHMKHCHVTLSGPSQNSLKMFLEMNPISNMMIGWILMVIAMMLPKLIMPIEYIYARSFKQLRFWVAISFVLGYVFIWTLAGIVLNVVIIAFSLLMPMSYIPAIIIGLIAIIWQFSPFKQYILNLGHNHKTISAFDINAFRNVLVFGVEHGIWCIGSGWALMLFPMLLPSGHNLAMFIVTFIMLSEHMEHPKSPMWHFSFRFKLLSIIINQTKRRLENT